MDEVIQTVELTTIFTPEVEGRVNIRAGGTYAVLVDVPLNSDQRDYLSHLATAMLGIEERTTYGTTDLATLGELVAARLRAVKVNHLAQEVLLALSDHSPETWFTRVEKPEVGIPSHTNATRS